MWESRLELTPELSDRGSHIIPYAWGGLSHALAPNHLSRLSRIGPFCGCGMARHIWLQRVAMPPNDEE